MGITHFAGLGKAPGAVTAALSYLKNEVGDDPEYGKIVENVVIFTSPEIANGSERAIESYDNAYMERGKCKGWTRGLINSFEIVKRFIFNEFEDVGLYLCEVNVNDFSKCFEAIAKALLKFHPPSRVGKHVWVNITGGTNILNAALMQVAHLSGLIPIIYYTFVANRDDNKYLKPFSKNENEFKFRKIHVIKTTFDERYLYILEELESCEGKSITDYELLNKLKIKHFDLFEGINLTTLRRDFLNIIIGVGRRRTEEREDLNFFLNEYGKEILSIMRSPLFKALVRTTDHPSIEIDKLTQDLKIKKIEKV